LASDPIRTRAAVRDESIGFLVDLEAQSPETFLMQHDQLPLNC
jgi:hypothetical protein